MAIPQAEIPQFTTQQPDLLANYAKIVQLKNMLGEQKEIPLDLQIKQQQVQQAQAMAPAQQQEASARASSAQTQAAMNAIALKSQQAQLAYWTNPNQYDSDPSESSQSDYKVERILGIDPNDPLAAMVRGQMKAGVDPNTALSSAKSILDFRGSTGKLDQDKQMELKTATENLDRITAPIVAQTDPQKRAEMLANAKPGLATWAQTVSHVSPQIGQVVAQLNPTNVEAFSNYIGAEGDALDFQIKKWQGAFAGVPKTQPEAAAQLAAANFAYRNDPSDETKAQLAKSQSAYDAITNTIQSERKFSSDLQEQNQKANKDLAMSNALAQKGIEDINKLWTDPQHGYGQVASQISMTKSAIEQAQNGSELAASLEPLMTALGVTSFAGVHRINGTEVNAAGPGVGSAYRKLNALLDRVGSGSIPDASLKEADQLVDTMLQARYDTSVASSQQIAANAGIPVAKISVPQRNDLGSRTTLDKVSTSTHNASSTKTSGGVSVTAPNGKTYIFPDQTSANSFKQKAGIQ